MSEIINFGISDPVRFFQQNTGQEYKARGYGKVIVNEYDLSRYPSKEELANAVRSNMKAVMEESLAKLPVDDIVYWTGTGILGPYLSEEFEKLGIKLDFENITFMLMEGSEKNYTKNTVFHGGEMPETEPEISLTDLIPEIHGAVTEVLTSYSRSGMMMGDNTKIEESLQWQEDGSLLIQKHVRDRGKGEDLEIIAGREAATKLRSFIADNHIAELAQVKPVPSLFMPTDVSVTSYLTVIYNDSGIGGRERVERRLDCTSKRTVLSDAVSEIMKLIRECESSGKVILKKEFTYDPVKPLTVSGSEGTKWKCECGQENSGKYCINCGLSRKLFWSRTQI